MNACFRYRYLICLIIFIVAVSFKLHMSSIGVWDDYITDTINNYQLHSSELWRKARGIRSDEWLVATPNALSQANTAGSFFPAFRGNIAVSLERPLVPVWDITAIGRPENWGFFLLGDEYGFSWFWCLKVIMLFMLSFEMGLILSNRQSFWGIIMACLVLFAPAVQWWSPNFAINVLLLIVSWDYFLCSPKPLIKILSAVLIGMGTIGFVLTIYPPTQVPSGYLIILFGMFLLYKNRDKLNNISKYHWILLILSIGIAFGIIVFFIFQNFEFFKKFASTEYPGNRVSVGGTLPWAYIYHELLSIHLPFSARGLYMNTCEMSSFITLFPIPFLIFSAKRIKDEGVLCCKLLFFYCLFLIGWIFVGYPELFAKITLLSYVPESRAYTMSFGLAMIFFTVAMLSNRIETQSQNKADIRKICVFLFYTVTVICALNAAIFEPYLSIERKVSSFAIFSLLAWLLIFGSAKKFAVILVFTSLIPSLFINPISRGLSPIYDKQLTEQVRSILRDDTDGVWGGYSNIHAQFVVALGGDVFNYVQCYPDWEKYEALDPDLNYRSIYNRFAHVGINIITSGEYSAVLHQADSFQINVPISDIVLKTPIKYFLTPQIIINNPNFEILWEAETQELYIYAINRDIQPVAAHESRYDL